MMAKKNSVLLLLLVVMLSCFVGMFAVQAIPATKASAAETVTAVIDTTDQTVSDNVPAGYSGNSYASIANVKIAVGFETVDVSSFDSSKAAFEFWIYVPDGSTYSFGTDNTMSTYNRWSTAWNYIEFDDHCTNYADAFASLKAQAGWTHIQIPLAQLMSYNSATINQVKGFELWGDNMAGMLIYGITFKEVDAPAVQILEHQEIGAVVLNSKTPAITSGGIEDINVPTGETGVSYKTSRADEIAALNFEDVDISSWDKSKLAIDFWIYVPEGTTYTGHASDGLYTSGGELRFKAHFNHDMSTLTFIQGWNKVRVPLAEMSGYTNYQTVQGLQLWGFTTGNTNMLVYGITLHEVETPEFKILEQYAAEYKEKYPLTAVITDDTASTNVPEGLTGNSYASSHATVMVCNFETVDISDITFAKAVLQLWIYIPEGSTFTVQNANADALNTNAGKLYFKDHFGIAESLATLDVKEGWNKIQIPLSSMAGYPAGYKQIKGIEFFGDANAEGDPSLIYGITFAEVEDSSLKVLEYQAITPEEERQETIDLLAADGTLYSGMGYVWAENVQERYVVDLAPTASSGKSLQVYTTWGSCFQGATIDISAFVNPVLSVWVYIDDTDYPSTTASTGFNIEVADYAYLHIPVTNCVNGWNKVILPISVDAITKVNMTVIANEGFTYDPAAVMFHNIQVVDYEGTETGVVATEAKIEASCDCCDATCTDCICVKGSACATSCTCGGTSCNIKAHDPISVFATDGTLMSGASWSWTSYMTESSIKDFAPSKSSGKSVNAYTTWGNNIAFETPIDISGFINPAISAWIYVENLDYIDNVNNRFAFETIDYQYSLISLEGFVRGWNKVIVPISGDAVNKIQIHVFANELFGYKSDFVWYHDIQIVDTAETGLVDTEEATTEPTPTPVPVNDFVLMNGNAELATGAEFGWGYIDDNNLTPVDISPNNDGYSMRLVTGMPGFLINFPVSLLPDYQIGAAAQFWFYVADPSVLSGLVVVEAKTYVYNQVSVANAIAGWNKVSVPIQAFADETSMFNIVFRVEESYLPGSILLHDIRIVDSAKSGIIETKALPESAAFESDTVNMSAENDVMDLPAITTSPNNVNLLWYYSSDKTDVVTVEDGVLYAHSNGTATITAKVGALTATLTVNVTGFKTAASVTITNEEIYITDGMEEVYIELSVKDSDGTEFDRYVAKYASSNKLVAVVDAEGKIIPLSNGETTITVTVGDVSDTILVTVEDIEEGIALQNRDGAVQLGGNYGWEGTYAGGGEALVVPFGESGAGRYMNAAGGLDITGITLDLTGLPRENMMWDLWLFIPESAGAPTDVKVDIMGGKKYYTIPGADLVNGYNHVQIPMAIDDLGAINRFSMFNTPTNASALVEIVVYNIKLIAVETPAYGIVEKQLIPETLTVSATEVTVTKTENNVALPEVTFGPDGAKANVVYTSSNKYIADVENGKIVGYANGTVTITVALAMDEDIYTTFTVNVSGFPDVTALIVTGGNEFTLAPMERLPLEVKPDKDGANVVLSYKSSNPAVALVSGNGTVTAVGEGECTITVKLEGTNITTSISIKVATAEEEPVETKGGCGSFVGGASMIAFSALTACAVVFMRKRAK